MNQDTPQINLNEAERLKNSFGFSLSNFSRNVSWILWATAMVLLTQLVRELILNFNQKLFLNDKFAFSINIPTITIYILYGLVFGLIIYYLSKQWTNLVATTRLGFIFILAGGLANLGERVYFGYVVDYIFLLNGVLNLADFYIFAGVVLVLLSRNNSEKI